MACTSYATGRVHAGEKDTLVLPRGAVRATARGVVFCHGASANGLVAVGYSGPGQPTLLRRLADHGYAIIAADLGAGYTQSNFGNAEHVARIGEARTYLGTLGVRIDKVHLVGASMGNVGALNYALANPTLVASITGVIPAYDIQRHRVLDTGPGLRASIDTAWGVTYPAALAGGANPADASTALVDVVPWCGYYATDDSAGLVQDATDLGALFGGLTSLGAVGHTDAAIGAVPADGVAAYFRDNE